jgi:putative transposase
LTSSRFGRKPAWHDARLNSRAPNTGGLRSSRATPVWGLVRIELLAALDSAARMSRFPGRLAHDTPRWVTAGALFHIRIRAEQNRSLTEPDLGPQLLCSATRYHELGHWWCLLFLLMPDHLHALLHFPPNRSMTGVVRDWKRGTSRFQGVRWQEGFFDHRLRNDKERRDKWCYIRRNPVAKGLCVTEEDWNWWWSAITSKGGAA